MLTVAIQLLNPTPKNSDIHRTVAVNQQADVDVLG